MVVFQRGWTKETAAATLAIHTRVCPSLPGPLVVNTVLLLSRRAPLDHARMIAIIFRVVPLVADVAIVAASQEPSHRINAVIMVRHFDEADFLVLRWSRKNELVPQICTDYLDLIISKNNLKELQFPYSACSLGTPVSACKRRPNRP